MVRRLLAVALILGLLVPSLPGIAAAKGTHGKSRGIAVQSASYDATTGKLTAKVRWNKRELRRKGRDELHLVVYQDSNDPAVLRNRTVTATSERHTRQYRIKLTKRQRNAAGDGSDLTIVATHKHDDDGGLFDRVWHHRLEVNAAMRDMWSNCGLIEESADLSGCNLSGADLTGVDLILANLGSANLSGTFLSWSFLTAANLTNANLTNASMYQTQAGEARLSSADMTGADLRAANLTDAILDSANLTGVYWCDTTMPDGSVNNSSC